MTINSYLVIVKHDNGVIRIITSASSVDKAKDIVSRSESCPLSAIQWAGIQPTKRQVQRTKRYIASF